MNTPSAPPVTSQPAHSSTQIVSIPNLPELFSSDFIDILLPVVPPTPKDPKPRSHPFTDALKKQANLIRTDNNAPAFASTESKTLDAFATLDSNVDKSQVHTMLTESWQEDPDTTLKIIWNLRSIHDGKASKVGFYRAYGWLYANHPKTAIKNLPLLVDRVVEKKLKNKAKGNTGSEHVEEEWTDVAGHSLEEPVLPVGFSHGYYKDLLNILGLAMTDQLTNLDATFDFIASPRPGHSPVAGRDTEKRRKKRQRAKAQDRENMGREKTAEKTAARIKASQDEAAAKARERRAQQAVRTHQRLVRKLSTDPLFKALYIAVAQIFARALSADIRLVRKISDPATSKEEKDKLKWQVTLAAKWAPTLGASHDSITNIGTAIALILYANGEMPDLKDIPLDEPVVEPAAQRLRSFLRRWIVSPLRRYAEVVEVMMSANEWKKINYSHVPSLSFARNKKSFFRHDPDRLKSYLVDIKSGKKTISGATIGPHDLVAEALRLESAPRGHSIDAALVEASKDVVNGQWNTMLERLRQAGTLDNCIAVCDVSGSMGTLSGSQSRGRKEVQPILPAVALTLVLAQLAKAPFNNTFITFSTNPEVVTISLSSQGNLVGAVREIGRANWAMSTDFNAVFMKLLLPMAVEHKLKRDEMVKRLFVFSDMQFDDASDKSSGRWETNHQQVVKAFDAAGYDVPEIVYWNLAGRKAAKPVTKNTPGVAMVSGFSGNLLKVFMENEEVEDEEWEDEKGEKIQTIDKPQMSPEEIMKRALGKKSYSDLQVFD